MGQGGTWVDVGLPGYLNCLQVLRGEFEKKNSEDSPHQMYGGFLSAS